LRARLALVFLAAVLLTAAVTALLITIFERQQEARTAFFQVVDIQPDEPDPEIWGRNFRGQYEAYTRTERTSDLVDYSKYGRYGGSEAFSRLDKYPNLPRLFAGYPFSVEYREDQGHLNAVEAVTQTQRLGDNKPGTCFTCKSSNVPTLMKTWGPEKFYATPMKEILAQLSPAHDISCADCHDADTMALRVTRPAFVEAMQRRGVDVTKATHLEARNYVCVQCHVEYYFRGDGKYLVFPWDKGYRIDDIEAYYKEIGFKDWDHGETKTPLVKMQHPENELFSTGIHARAGVTCPDCHMPYKREGAVKITDHWIRSPLVNLTNACATCHRASEEEMRQRVIESQDRTFLLLERSENAIVAAQDAIKAAMDGGVSDASLAEARNLHRRAFIRWDFISAENSMGFHSPQEAARALGDSIDYARQSELAARRAMEGQR
jgi:nitrite reductase (cytochrome c-552)